MVSLLDEYYKFKQTVKCDATTLMLFDDVLCQIENDEDYDEYTSDPEFQEELIEYCYNYDFDWSYGLGYDDIMDIVECVVDIYKTDRE